jgi:hypothetical protein
MAMLMNVPSRRGIVTGFGALEVAKEVFAGGQRRVAYQRRLWVTPGRTPVEHIESTSFPTSGHLADMPSPPLGATS